MTTTTVPDIESHVREVTTEEVSAYRQQGWVTLPQLISSELAEDLLARVKAISGLDYDELPRDHPDAQAVMEKIRGKGIWKTFSMSRLHDQHVWDIITSRSLGEASAQLSGRRPMRLFSDGVLCKMPAWTGEEQLTSGPAADVYTGATPWHQDFNSQPYDRVGAVLFWIALSEVTPEMGSVQYLTGSHHEPPLGAVQYNAGGQSLKEFYPELWEKYELSPPQHLQPGDVVAHHTLVIHYAEPNHTDRLRWAHTSQRIPADALYNGIPYSRFPEYGIEFKQWKPLDHPSFPIVSE
jgi:Phytanoyl-CoA dioxygenase (PhyH)